MIRIILKILEVFSRACAVVQVRGGFVGVVSTSGNEVENSSHKTANTSQQRAHINRMTTTTYQTSLYGKKPDLDSQVLGLRPHAKRARHANSRTSSIMRFLI